LVHSGKAELGLATGTPCLWTKGWKTLCNVIRGPVVPVTARFVIASIAKQSSGIEAGRAWIASSPRSSSQ
jgi:hypothetical protein